MVQISAKLVKELREKTGAGMMDCKKALKEADGNIEDAVDVLRKSGIAKAEKKAGRSATEGKIISKIATDEGILAEILCETDFVAKNDKFIAFGVDILASISNMDADGDISDKVNEIEKEKIISMVASLGENIQVRRVVKWHGKCSSYLHMGGRIGVMIEVEGASDEEALNNICMHIAAFNPQYISSKDISESVIAKEKEIHTAQLAGKPAQMIDKIMIGKLNKWYKEVCLNDQPWIRDDKVSTAEANPNLTVKRFVRWQVGEEL